MRAFVKGVSTYLPETIYTNKDLEEKVNTSDEWIRSRTGIEQRRLFNLDDKNITTSEIAAKAGQKVLEQTGVNPLEIDAIILGSMYPDYGFPATSCIVQSILGCDNAFAYDVTAACAFIPFGMNQATLLIESGQCKNVLIIGAELSSRVVDWEDRNTCVLFGDGAGAILLSSCENESEGVISSVLKSDGKQSQILKLRGNLDENPFLQMEGKAVFKMAVTEMAAVIEQALAKVGLSKEDLNLLIPHQANIRILDATAKRLNLNPDQLMVNVQRYGNTSSASIPIALEEAIEADRIKKGDLIAFVAIGGGMSWGCNIIRW